MTLTDRVNHLKRLYWWQTGEPAEQLYVPRGELRRFAQAIVDEVGASETGPVHHVYHFLSTGERTMSFCGLEVRVLVDGSDIGVGRAMQ